MANDLRKQEPEAATTPQDRDRSALLALSAKWATSAVQAASEPHNEGMQEPEADRVPASLVSLRVRVRMVECANGAAGEAQIAACFAEEAAAEAFIRSKVANGKSFGSDSGRHWGQNTAGDQVCYWIETEQETASAEHGHGRK